MPMLLAAVDLIHYPSHNLAEEHTSMFTAQTSGYSMTLHLAPVAISQNPFEV